MTTNFLQSTRDETTIRLEIRRTDGWSHFHEISDGQTVTVGSKESCIVHLLGESVAPIHCVLRSNAGELWVQDWYTSNGTLVNGEPITEETRVSSADDIRVGDYTFVPRRGQSSDGGFRDDHDAEQTSAAQHHTVQDHTEPVDTEQDSTSPKQKTADWDDSPNSVTNVEVVREVDNPVDERESYEESETLSKPPSDNFDIPENIPAGERDSLEESETLPQPSFEDFDVLENDFDDATSFELSDSLDQETIELLRAEVEELQCELFQREQEVEELRAQNQFDVEDPLPDESAETSVRLVERMEELLEELENNDDRTAQLEELLRCSEEAARAEQEERRHLEAWFNDIEHRLSQRESEWKAEEEVLQQRLNEMAQKRRQLEQHLRQSRDTGQESKAHECEMQRLSEENEQLRSDFEKAEQELQQRTASQQQTTEAEFAKRVEAEVDARLREEQIQMAQERALMARQKAELISLRSEIERLSRPEVREGCNIDARVREFREHLREIHNKEQNNVENRSLTQRVANLWRRLEGRE